MSEVVRDCATIPKVYSDAWMDDRCRACFADRGIDQGAKVRDSDTKSAFINWFHRSGSRPSVPGVAR